MIKTFIYGTPHGFDLYEDESAFRDYFKGFYISSRKGKRLMINRRENGKTAYNYLHYGLMEVGGRPNSFFGMSLILDNNCYCSDFKKMQEWFDYIFDKIFIQDKIFQKNEAGIIQYKINNFGEVKTAVEWIKSNLPNIFSSAAGTIMDKYDNSFLPGKIGQVVRFDDQENNDDILSAFKQYSWISISPEYYNAIPRTDKKNIVDIELEYGDLLYKLNDYNKRLLPIATGIKTSSLSFLKDMRDESFEIKESIIQYVRNIPDGEEKKCFNKLGNEYNLLGESIVLLIKKMFLDLPSSKIKMQYNSKCKQKKDPSYFSSSESLKSIECENGWNKNKELGKILSTKCGKQKHLEYCTKKKDIYNDFLSNHSNQIDAKIINLIRLIGGILTVIIIVFLLLRSCSNNNRQESFTTEVIANNSVSSKEGEEFEKNYQLDINKLIEEGDLKTAYMCIEKKKDTSYTSQMKDGVEKQLISILYKEQSHKDSLSLYYLENIELLNYSGFTDSIKEYWSQLFEDYDKFKAIINKKDITQSDYNVGIDIIGKYSDRFKNLTDSLNQCKVINSVSTIQDQSTLVSPVTTFIVLNGNDEVTKTGYKIGMSYTVGTEIKIVCNKGAISFSKKCPFKNITREDNGLRINLNVAGRYVFRCNNVEITIIAEKVKPRTH